MDWQAALRARAVSARPKTYWVNAPQGTARPYVTLLDLTAGRPQHLNGFDLEPSRVQVDVWGDTYAQVQTDMEAVLAVLVPGAANSNGHNFSRAEVELGPRDVPERDGDTIIYRKSADLIIHHTAV